MSAACCGSGGECVYVWTGSGECVYSWTGCGAVRLLRATLDYYYPRPAARRGQEEDPQQGQTGVGSECLYLDERYSRAKTPH